MLARSASPSTDRSAPLTLLIWATDDRLGQDLVGVLAGPGRPVRLIASDAELASIPATSDLLVAQAGPRLEAQRAFLRTPLILVDPDRRSCASLVHRAYAVVRGAADCLLAVDRFVEHRDLAARVVGRQGPPRCCSRCGRGFDPIKAHGGGIARRFVRFGAIALCGGCLEDLRQRLRRDQTPYVEADARR